MLKALNPSQLSLEFAAAGHRGTYLARQYAAYPFHICRPFWLEQDPEGMATLYLQSCSGGLYGGDHLYCSVTARPGSRAHVTPQASTILHALEGESVSTDLLIHADERAILEVINEPLILFPGASLDARVAITCAGDAVVLYHDAFLAHDPEGGGGVFGRLSSSLSVTFSGDEEAAVLDRMQIDGACFRDALPGASGRWAVHGSYYVISRNLEAARFARNAIEQLTPSAELYAGGSILPSGSGVIFRIAATSAVSYRRAISSLWQATRFHMFGLVPQSRRK